MTAHGTIFTAGEERPPAGGVGQDKIARQSDRTKLYQPVIVLPKARSNTPSARTKKHSIKRHTLPVMIWAKPAVQAEVRRVADQAGLSISTVGAQLLEGALRQDLATQHATLLQPMLDQSIRKRMRFMAELLLLLIYDCSQMKYLLVNSLGRLPDYPVMSEDMFNHVRDESTRAAKRDVRNRSPHLKAFIAEELEHFLKEEEA